MEQNESVELMYRAPGRKTHQNLPKILDEVFERLDKLNERLTNLVKSL